MASESTQHKLNRVRHPRVEITYDVELGCAIEQRELPFVVGVLANLAGKAMQPLPPLKARRFVEINHDNFDDVMNGIAPRLAFRVSNKLSNNDSLLPVELCFSKLEDFEPEQVVSQLEPLRKLLEVRHNLSALLTRTDRNGELEEALREFLCDPKWSRELAQASQTSQSEAPVPAAVPGEHNLQDLIIARVQNSQGDGEFGLSHRVLTTFVEEVRNGSLRASKDIEVTIYKRVEEIDRLLSHQLNEILHTSEFQQLEASWRGLYYLVAQTEASTRLKIRVMTVSKEELCKDLEKAVEFDQSAIFRTVYEEEYGTFGGQPFGALIGDYEFGPNPQDITLLSSLASVAAAAYVPFLSAASPQLLGLQSFVELAEPRDLSARLHAPEYARWRSFRDSSDSRYVGLTLPHILLRLPYGPATNPVEAFNFVEEEATDNRERYLWGNAAYALGSCLTTAFAKYSWCAAIRGVEGGGVVEGLPTHTFRSEEEITLKCPTEIAITDRREKEISDLGLIPLVHLKGTDYAVFFSMQSCQKPKKFDSYSANANSRLTGQLQYVLTTSRFAHYIKTMMRDRIGSVLSRGDCERFLNQWICRYVMGSDEVEAAYKAKFPLREARIDVVEVPGKPGIYKAVCFLRPHFQLDELSISLRIIVEIPPPRGT